MCYDYENDYNNQDLLCGTYIYSNLTYTGTGQPPTATQHVHVSGTVKYWDIWEPDYGKVPSVDRGRFK